MVTNNGRSTVSDKQSEIVTINKLTINIPAVRQRAGSFQVVPTRPGNPALYTQQKMFDKERFHNALALSLGYERIVKDKRITINVDDSDDPWVTLKFQGCPEVVRFKASGEADADLVMNTPAMQDEINCIIDSVHQAYLEACKPF